MFDIQRSSTAGGAPMSDGLARRRDRVQRSLKGSRDTNKLNRYYERKAAGLCTSCGEPAAPDRQQCQPHLDAAREASRVSKERSRQECRDQGLCATGCGRKSDTYRCLVCDIRAGRIPTEGVHSGVHDARPRPVEQRLERDSTAGSGVTTGVRLRNRFAGRGGAEGRRGAPSREQLDVDILRDATFSEIEIAKFKRAFALAMSPEVASMPRVQRDAVRSEAAGIAAYAARFLDDIVDRLKK